ncbi:hypothetical protein EI94DRAFT_1731693 [Lactarius quietus]|nr:hypothetical protein EI94DRAFT_1731693 [Lactarius quietus]
MLSDSDSDSDSFIRAGSAAEPLPRKYTDSVFDLEEDDEYVGTQPVPKPPLRSRPATDFSDRRFSGVGTDFGIPPASDFPERFLGVGTDFGVPPAMDFPERFSGVGTDFGVPTAAHRPRPPSHMSGSTLNSGIIPSTAHSYSHKTYTPTNPPAGLSSEAIASLSLAQLYQNPLHRRVLQMYNNVCEVLIQRDLADVRARWSDVAPSITPHTHPALTYRDTDNRASSLGPSDSASQQRMEVTTEWSIEGLLARVEPPPVRPECLRLVQAADL